LSRRLAATTRDLRRSRAHDGSSFVSAEADNAGNNSRNLAFVIRFQRLLPAALLAALMGAPAAAPQPPGPTYRTIGPDGKVTFSDRKPTDPNLRTRELGEVVTAPLVAPPGSQPFDLRPATSFPPNARMSANDGIAPPRDISGKPFPPGLPDAILDVLVHQFFVQTIAETCSRVQPAATERYQLGVLNWRDRNAAILAGSNRITFTRFTGEQRDTLRATARSRLAPLLPAPGSPDAEKAAWCDRNTTDLSRHQFELVGDLRVAPIVNFEAP
jgi:hypothetical protein